MKHPVTDTDTHFIIDGATRLVKNATDTKSMLVQYDHNSEQFTFRVPRKVDDHDLSLCNLVRVHFINIDKSKRVEKGYFNDITDSLAVYPEDDEYVTCAWLVPREATQLAGYLHFVIQFACVDGKETLYSWNTAKYTGITIADGINTDEEFLAENLDSFREWEDRLKACQIVSIEQTQISDEPEGENVWTVTFANETTSNFTVKNGAKGERGETGYVGSIETVQGDILHFFVGTKEEYEALTEAQKENLFAIISDDTSKDTIMSAFEDIKNDYVKTGGSPLTMTADPSASWSTAVSNAYSASNRDQRLKPNTTYAVKIFKGNVLVNSGVIVTPTIEDSSSSSVFYQFILGESDNWTTGGVILSQITLKRDFDTDATKVAWSILVNGEPSDTYTASFRKVLSIA